MEDLTKIAGKNLRFESFPPTGFENYSKVKNISKPHITIKFEGF